MIKPGNGCFNGRKTQTTPFLACRPQETFIRHAGGGAGPSHCLRDGSRIRMCRIYGQIRLNIVQKGRHFFTVQAPVRNGYICRVRNQ